MRVKILVCKICGAEIESTRLWIVNMQAHLEKHDGTDWLYKKAITLRKKYFTEKTVNVSGKIKEAPHYGTTTD